MTGAQIAENTIASEHLREGSVGTDQIADNAIGTAQLDAAVVGALLAVNAVTSEHVLDGSLSGSDISQTADLVVSTIQSTGQLWLGNNVVNDGVVGDIQLYDTGNNRHRTYGVGPNAFLTDIDGTDAVGNWEVRDFSVDVSTGDLSVSAGYLSVGAGAVLVGVDPPAGKMGVRCVPGEPCAAIHAGNLKFTGGGNWHGGNPDNATVLFDYTGTGWGSGNKVVRLVNRDGEESFSLTTVAACVGTPPSSPIPSVMSPPARRSPTPRGLCSAP